MTSTPASRTPVLPRVSRRGLLIGAAATGGLALAWAAWPRHYDAQVDVAPGEQAFDALLKIDRAGQVIVLVPQCEMGQGVYTTLPQILADELGADWRTVAVQPVSAGPLYANTLLVREWIGTPFIDGMGGVGDYALDQYAQRNGVALTGGSTSVRMFADRYRDAGAAARVLLCQAAAARWDVAWEACDIIDGIVTNGTQRARIGDLVDDAVTFSLPDILPLRQTEENRLTGTDVPRLDAPAKIDGSANFAADIRLPDMVFASIRQGPVGASALQSMNVPAARKIAGVVGVHELGSAVAVTATNWWAANQALGRLDPVFVVEGAPFDDEGMWQALEGAFSREDGARIVSRGNLVPVFNNASVIASEYRIAPALHLAIEPPCATARVRNGLAEVWTGTQASGFVRNAVARALGFDADAVTVYPMLSGGSHGRAYETDVAVQAARIAQDVGRPVQLLYARSEDIMSDRPRPPAVARMVGKLGRGGMVEGVLAKVATPDASAQCWSRMARYETAAQAINVNDTATRNAVSGVMTGYDIPNLAVDHYPARIALPTGRWRSNAHHIGAFASECFIDEMARAASIDPMSFRMQMLGSTPRLAHCLATAASLSGWKGGIAGSGQGIACHAMAGSFIAVVAEAAIINGRIRLLRATAVADVGEAINPDIVRQMIEGGLIYGFASATGCTTAYAGALPVNRQIHEMKLPTLADVGDITIELVRSTHASGGASALAVPVIAPAVANALATTTGQRYRSLPLLG